MMLEIGETILMRYPKKTCWNDVKENMKSYGLGKKNQDATHVVWKRSVHISHCGRLIVLLMMVHIKQM